MFKTLSALRQQRIAAKLVLRIAGGDGAADGVGGGERVPGSWLMHDLMQFRPARTHSAVAGQFGSASTRHLGTGICTLEE